MFAFAKTPDGVANLWFSAQSIKGEKLLKNIKVTLLPKQRTAIKVVEVQIIQAPLALTIATPEFNRTQQVNKWLANWLGGL